MGEKEKRKIDSHNHPLIMRGISSHSRKGGGEPLSFTQREEGVRKEKGAVSE